MGGQMGWGETLQVPYPPFSQNAPLPSSAGLQ